jgi:hypothetical protein
MPGGRETWYNRLANYDTLVRLRRAVEKCVTFHRHVMTLVRFACSPRMRKLIGNTKLQFIPVVHQSPLSKTWPSNREEWEQLRENIYDRYIQEDKDYRDKKKEKAAIDRLVGMTKALGVHCECALVSYIHRNPDSSFPAFSYIGVSKLSCKPCHLWLSAYNLHAKSGGGYYTRGSHDKWYLGWKTPSLDANMQAKVDEALVSQVEKEYSEKEKERRTQAKRIRSDNVYVPGGKVEPTKFEEVQILSSIQAFLQRNAGRMRKA